MLKKTVLNKIVESIRQMNLCIQLKYLKKF